MKFITSIVLIALLSFATCLYLPWWSIAVVAFIVVAAIPQTSFKSFLSGFIALFLLWGVLAFCISSANNNLLAHKVSLFILKVDNPYLLIFITALLGGVIGGLAALSGSFVRKK